MADRHQPPGPVPGPPTLLGKRADDARELRGQLRRLAGELERANAQRDELLDSRSFRFGRELAESMRRPWRLPGLPWRLFRIARETSATAAPVDPAASRTPSLRLPAAPGKEGFRLAALVDEFTALGLQGECELLLVTPDMEARELAEFRPHLLLVESAWSGHAGSWRGRIVPPSHDLLSLLGHCSELGIATVFWNKEDPSHFEHFLDTGRFFDFLLTTDADSIPAYRERTGRESVGVMEFACQPRLHHPVDAGPREQAFLFAGSYYAKYPERTADFERLVEGIPESVPVHIYDRNLGRGDKAFIFPDRYQPFIRGRLPADQVSQAYRRYAYAINLNTIKRSPTMLSRRVLELLACNTLVLSNPSTAMQAAFGAAVLVDPEPRTLADVLADPLAQARRRLAGLRAVMQSHTWAHRVVQLRSLVEPSCPGVPSPGVRVYVRASSADSVARLLAQFQSQIHVAARLCLVADPAFLGPQPLPPGVEWLAPEHAANERLPDDGSAVMAWDERDAHGPGLLVDLALAGRYWPVAAVGKAGDQGEAYTTTASLPLRGSLVFDPSRLPAHDVAALLEQLADGRLEGEGLLRIDAFNFRVGANGRLPADASETG